MRIHLRQAIVVEVAPAGAGTTKFISNQTLARCEEACPWGAQAYFSHLDEVEGRRLLEAGVPEESAKRKRIKK